MIIEGLFSLIFELICFAVDLFPTITFVDGSSITATGTLISYALTWFPIDLWIAILANIIFWISVQAGWIVIEWVYKKIPGVD